MPESDLTRLERRIRESERTIDGLTWFVIGENTFAIPFGDGYLFFAPLHGIALLLTRAGFASLLLNGTEHISQALTSCAVSADRAVVKALEVRPKPPDTGIVSAAEFAPTSLTLSPTAACQLACEYCYIRGGDSPRHMPWEVAEAAIRLVAANCSRSGEPSLSVMFHGQGEPTANWKLFRDAVLFAGEECRSRGLQPRFSVVTNGILSEAQVSFLAEQSIDVSISLDSLRESTDRQRPLRKGGSTFELVTRTMRWLDEKGLEFAIRSTVTSRTTPEMADFVAFIHATTKCRHVHFEPVCMTGRAAAPNESQPRMMAEFTDGFLGAETSGLAVGTKVEYSGARLRNLRTSFCGAYGSGLNFVVSTEGLVSSCNEVLDESDPRSALFIYGRYDAQKRDFSFAIPRLERLLSLNVNQISRCRDCFLKWNCGGDCIAKAALGGFQHLTDEAPLERCTANRTLARRELFKSILVR